MEARGKVSFSDIEIGARVSRVKNHEYQTMAYRGTRKGNPLFELKYQGILVHATATYSIQGIQVRARWC